MQDKEEVTAGRMRVERELSEERKGGFMIVSSSDTYFISKELSF